MALNTHRKHYPLALVALGLLLTFSASSVSAASSGLCPPSWNIDLGNNVCANIRDQCVNNCDCIYEELYIYQGQETYCCRSVNTYTCRPSSYSCESGWTEGERACYTLATQDCKANSQGVFQSIMNPKSCCVCRNSEAWLEREAAGGDQVVADSAGCKDCLQGWNWTPSTNAKQYLYLISSIQAAETVGSPGEVFNFFKTLGGSDVNSIDPQAAMDEIGNSFKPLAACLERSCSNVTMWLAAGGHNNSTGGRRRLHQSLHPHRHRNLLADDASGSAGTAASGGPPIPPEMAPYVQQALDEINRGDISVENLGIRAAVELNEALANGDVTEAELTPFLEASSAPLLSAVAEGYNIGLQALLDFASVGFKLPGVSSVFTGFIADESTNDLMDGMVLASVSWDLEDCLNTYDPLKICKNEPETSESRAKCVAYVRKMQRICANKHYLRAAVLQEALQTQKAYLDTIWAGVSLARAFKKNMEWTRAIGRGAYPNTINRLFNEMKNGYTDGAVAMGKATKDFVDEATSDNLDHLQNLVQNGPGLGNSGLSGTSSIANTGGATDASGISASGSATDASGSSGTATDVSGSAGSAIDASGSSGSVGEVSNMDVSGSSGSATDTTAPGKDCTGAGSQADDVCWDPEGTGVSVESQCAGISYSYMKQYTSKYRTMDAHECNKAACADCAANPEGGSGDPCLTVAHNVCSLCCG